MKIKLMAILCILSTVTIARPVSVSRPASTVRSTPVRVSSPRPVPKSSAPTFKSTPKPTSVNRSSTSTTRTSATKSTPTVSTPKISNFTNPTPARNTSGYNGTGSSFYGGGYNDNSDSNYSNFSGYRNSGGSSFLENYMWYNMLFRNNNDNKNEDPRTRDERIIRKLREKLAELREDKTKDNSEEIKAIEYVIKSLSTK